MKILAKKLLEANCHREVANIRTFWRNAIDKHPQLNERQRKIAHDRMEALVVARMGDSNQFAAYSKLTGEWTVHEFENGVTAIPLLGNNLAVFQLRGERINELVAVDSNGKWQRQKLPESTQECVPVVSSNISVVTIGKQCYGFSGALGKWASTDTTAVPSVLGDTAMIVGNDRITMFSAQSARWSTSPNLSIAR